MMSANRESRIPSTALHQGWAKGNAFNCWVIQNRKRWLLTA
jgi:hypothetical protein